MSRRRAAGSGRCLARDLVVVGIALGHEGHDRYRVVAVDGEATDAGIADLVDFQKLLGFLFHPRWDIDEEVPHPGRSIGVRSLRSGAKVRNGIGADRRLDLADLAHPARSIDDHDIGKMVALRTRDAALADWHIGERHIIFRPRRLAGKREAGAGDEPDHAIMQAFRHLNLPLKAGQAMLPPPRSHYRTSSWSSSASP